MGRNNDNSIYDNKKDAIEYDCVPRDKLRAYPQQWLPGESNN